MQERQGSAQIRAGPAATHVKLSLCSLCHGHRVPCPHLQRVSLSFLSVTGLVVQTAIGSPARICSVCPSAS